MDEKIRTAVSYLRRFPELVSLEEMLDLKNKFQYILNSRKFWIRYMIVTEIGWNSSTMEFYTSEQTFAQILPVEILNVPYQEIIDESAQEWVDKNSLPKAGNSYSLTKEVSESLFFNKNDR